MHACPAMSTRRKKQTRGGVLFVVSFPLFLAEAASSPKGSKSALPPPARKSGETRQYSRRVFSAVSSLRREEEGRGPHPTTDSDCPFCFNSLSDGGVGSSQCYRPNLFSREARHTDGIQE